MQRIDWSTPAVLLDKELRRLIGLRQPKGRWVDHLVELRLPDP